MNLSDVCIAIGYIIRHCFIADKMPDKPARSMSGKIGLHISPLFVSKMWLKILLPA